MNFGAFYFCLSFLFVFIFIPLFCVWIFFFFSFFSSGEKKEQVCTHLFAFPSFTIMLHLSLSLTPPSLCHAPSSRQKWHRDELSFHKATPSHSQP